MASDIFLPKLNHLAFLISVFADQIPDAGPCQNKLYHIQFKNVPILGREPAPVQTPSVVVTNPQPAPVPITTAPPAPEAAPGVAPRSLQVPAKVSWFDSGVDLPLAKLSQSQQTELLMSTLYILKITSALKLLPASRALFLPLAALL